MLLRILVGFAPARPDRHDWLISLLEGVEDIPGTALHEGLPWTWQTFDEYLTAVDALPHDIDIATRLTPEQVTAALPYAPAESGVSIVRVTATTAGATHYFNSIRQGSVATDESVFRVSPEESLRKEPVTSRRGKKAERALLSRASATSNP